MGPNKATRSAGARWRWQTLGSSEVKEARDRIAPYVARTPIFSAGSLGRAIGVRLHLKAELFQKTGSFKVRGVFNRLLTLSPEELARGLISISAGNFAAALAFATSQVGARATIVMPAGAARSKIDATESYGGEVILTQGNLLEESRSIQQDRGLTFVHPFDDLEVMAGHGTIGLEILEDLPDVEVVVVPIGGGGLIGGIAAAIKTQRSDVRVVGVEPATADAMSRSLAEGRPVHLDHPQSVADGLAAPFAGEHTLAHVKEFVDEVAVISDESILAGLRMLITRAKLAAEPAAAAPVAALLSGALKLPADSRVICLVSGGNVDLEVLKRVL